MSYRSDSPANDVALVAVFAGLIAAFSLAPPIPVGPVPVPITLQTLAVALTAMILGPWRGGAATALYVLVGLVGLPVFAGGASGVGVLAGASAGYLLAFPFAAFLVGLLARLVFSRAHSTAGVRWALLFLSGIAGSFAFIHPLGILGLVLNARLELPAALATDLLFWPGDVIKNAIAATVAMAVHRAFPRLLAPQPVGLMGA